jgi:hypothetical protein
MTVNPIGPIEPAVSAVVPVDQPQFAAAAPAAGSAGAGPPSQSVDLYEHSSRSGGTDVMLLQPEAQARFLANPATLGERMLGNMEGFHNRANAAREMIMGDRSGGDRLPGPAARDPSAAGRSGTAQPADDMIDDIINVVVRSSHWVVETNLVAGGAKRMGDTTSTLLRGQ